VTLPAAFLTALAQPRLAVDLWLESRARGFISRHAYGVVQRYQQRRRQVKRTKVAATILVFLPLWKEVRQRR
jgi:hypothetical protein